MIIEFIGASGSGKTYLAEKLAEYLRSMEDKNYLVLTQKDWSNWKLNGNEFRFSRVIKKLWNCKELFIDKTFISLLLKRLKCRKKCRKASFKYIIAMMNNYYLIFQLFKEIKDKKCIFIVDEGILTSVGFMFCIENHANVDELTNLMNKVKDIKSIGYDQQKKIYVSVYCDGYEETMRRVRGREQGSGYLRLSYEEGLDYHRRVVQSQKMKEIYLEKEKADFITIDNSVLGNKDHQKYLYKVLKLLEKHNEI